MAVQIDVGEQPAVAGSRVSCVASPRRVTFFPRASSEARLEDLGEKQTPRSGVSIPITRIRSRFHSSQTDIASVSPSTTWITIPLTVKAPLEDAVPRRAEAEGGEKPRHEDCSRCECSPHQPSVNSRRSERNGLDRLKLGPAPGLELTAPGSTVRTHKPDPVRAYSKVVEMGRWTTRRASASLGCAPSRSRNQSPRLELELRGGRRRRRHSTRRPQGRRRVAQAGRRCPW